MLFGSPGRRDTDRLTEQSWAPVQRRLAACLRQLMSCVSSLLAEGLFDTNQDTGRMLSIQAYLEMCQVLKQMLGYHPVFPQRRMPFPFRRPSLELFCKAMQRALN